MASGATSIRCRSVSPSPRSATPFPVIIGGDHLKKTNELLTQEVALLRAKVVSLELELEKAKEEAQEESAKCKAANELIKSLRQQLETTKLPNGGGGFQVGRNTPSENVNDRGRGRVRFRYVAPEQVPVQYGGLSREGEQEFSSADPATEEIIKPASKHTVEFPVSEACHLVWEVRVVGWGVSYGAEFWPSAEVGYFVIVQKSRKIGSADEQVMSNSFKISEPGKVVLTFDNRSYKKKKLLYRSKTKPSD